MPHVVSRFSSTVRLARGLGELRRVLDAGAPADIRNVTRP
jgi:hypothetical protein